MPQVQLPKDVIDMHTSEADALVDLLLFISEGATDDEWAKKRNTFTATFYLLKDKLKTIEEGYLPPMGVTIQ